MLLKNEAANGCTGSKVLDDEFAFMPVVTGRKGSAADTPLAGAEMLTLLLLEDRAAFGAFACNWPALDAGCTELASSRLATKMLSVKSTDPESTIECTHLMQTIPLSLRQTDF